jgi:hypothetical protein
LILKHNPNPNQDAFFRFRPGCELRIEPARPACQSKRRAYPRPRRLPTGGIAKIFWALRRVTRINCGTQSKNARVGRRTWTRATPRDATRRRRHSSHIVARRVDLCASALPAVLVRRTTSVLQTARFRFSCSKEYEKRPFPDNIYIKIRLSGFTTLHDSRRYKIPRCLGASRPDTRKARCAARMILLVCLSPFCPLSVLSLIPSIR